MIETIVNVIHNFFKDFSLFSQFISNIINQCHHVIQNIPILTREFQRAYKKNIFTSLNNFIFRDNLAFVSTDLNDIRNCVKVNKKR